MKTPTSALDRLGYAVKLPFSIFAEDEDRMIERLDAMHRSMPATLPEKRFFKH